MENVKLPPRRDGKIDWRVRRDKKERKAKFSIRTIIVASIALFIGFIIFRMATMETNVNLVTTYKLPKGVSFENVGSVLSNSQWAVAIDGKIVTAGPETKVQPTASTTKMILSLAIMEQKPFDLDSAGETIKITKEMYDKYTWYVSHNGSNTKVAVGEEISEKDALISVMLASSNNMADSLAIWAFGSIEEYQKYATEMLFKLGVSSTKLGTKDASGYDESTTSTPEDLAIIGYHVLKNPVLREIVNKKSATVPVAGEIVNTNKLLGQNGIIGVKTGYIGDPSGYCIISGYLENEHIITVSMLGSKTRERSFNGNLAVVEDMQEVLKPVKLISEGDEVGYYETWWTGKVPVKTVSDFSEVNYEGMMDPEAEILVNALKIKFNDIEYRLELNVPDFERQPNLAQRFLHVFGWKAE